MASLHVPNGEDKFPDPKSMTLAVLGCGQLLLSLAPVIPASASYSAETASREPYLHAQFSTILWTTCQIELNCDFRRHARYCNPLRHTLFDHRSFYLSVTCISRLRHSYAYNRLLSSTDAYKVHCVCETSGISQADTQRSQRIPANSHNSTE
jgi:hypothetical protein